MNRSLARAAMLVMFCAVCSFGLARAEPAAQAALPAEVIDVEWALVSLQPSGEAAEDTTGLGLTLKMAGDGTVSGSGGCNRLVSGYTVGDGQNLTLGPIAGTLIACEAAIAEREQRYFQALEAVSAYSLESGRLTLQSGDSGKLVYASSGGGSPAQLPATGAGGWSVALVLAAAASVIAGLVARRAAGAPPVVGE